MFLSDGRRRLGAFMRRSAPACALPWGRPGWRGPASGRGAPADRSSSAPAAAPLPRPLEPNTKNPHGTHTRSHTATQNPSSFGQLGTAPKAGGVIFLGFRPSSFGLGPLEEKRKICKHDSHDLEESQCKCSRTHSSVCGICSPWSSKRRPFHRRFL